MITNSILTENDLRLITPHLLDVVNLEIKQYKMKKEILFEHSDGKKYICTLLNNSLKIKELTGLSSIAAYFARGNYGDNSYLGNCSGLLIKDLLQHFKPSFVIDPMCGSNTAGDCCSNLNIPHLSLDLNPKFGGFNCLTTPLPRSSFFIFWHPPYYVFNGSKMPTYSGNMWGKYPNPSDGSHIHDKMEFIKWINQCEANIYQGLRKGGRMCILIGDSRYKGEYFSPYKEMDIYGDIESVMIKREFNCKSDSTKYNNNFIPIEHEYLAIVKKNYDFIIHCLVTKRVAADIMKSAKITWRCLIQNIIENFGGKATREQLFNTLKVHPKAASNNHLKEKLRQVINAYPTEFVKNGEVVQLAT